MPKSMRPCLAFLAASLLASPPPSFAYYTPMSEQAVREAYFLGQSHDGSYEARLEKHTKFLPPPKTGPHICSVVFMTPFLLFAEYASRQFNYSAPQAAIDYRNQGEEIVRILVEIQLTASYGQFISTPENSGSNSPFGFILRTSDFWRDFQVQIYDGDERITTSAFHGHANYACSKTGCTLIGATLEFEFPAVAFTSDTATIEVTPPEGDAVSVEFDLNSLR
jgi:hypothetical protein